MNEYDIVTMTKEAIDNYGEEYDGVSLVITHKATKYMPAKEFFNSGRPDGYHPGYDEGCGSPLFDLKIKETGEDLGFSLYRWELLYWRQRA